MHIVVLCNEYPPYSHGGIGVLYQTIARRLVQAGLSVTVVGIYKVKKLEIDNDQGVQVYRIPAIFLGFFTALISSIQLNFFLLKIHVQKPIDIIEGSEVSFALIFRRTPGKKVIRMSGGHNFFSVMLGKKTRFLTSLMEKISFSKADNLIAVSNFVAEATRIILKLGDREIKVLPNPVDTTFFYPHSENLEVPGSILFVGTVTEKKGVQQLVDAMPIIKKSIPNAHLYIVGRDSISKVSGVSFTETIQRSIPSEILDSINFVGPVQNKDIPDWIARCQVCVYPSHMEAQGIVVIEAMSAGKAVIASQTGPGSELIDDGINGLLCDPFSPNSIAENIILLLGNDPLRQALSNQARIKAIEYFSIDVLILKNIEFYTRII